MSIDAGTEHDEALRAAYLAHAGEVHRFARRLLRDEHDAQDAVQETFLRAWRAAERFDPQRASLRVWLFAIARNVVIDALRARSARPWLAQLAAPEDLRDAPAADGDRTEHALQRSVVVDLLRRLSPDQRRAIAETVLRDRPYGEVAAELGVPVPTLRGRVFHGLRALREAA